MIEKIATETVLLYSSYALLGILFFTTLILLFSFANGKKKGTKGSEKRMPSLSEEIDKMVFEYMVGKPHGSQSDKEHKTNLYYALLSHRENIEKIYRIVSETAGVKEGYKEIEEKAAEIIKALDESEGVHFVKDEVMPCLYVENDDSKSMKILAMYEDLSSILYAAVS